ncbi:MAG: hypothetical protein ACHP8B_01735 [Terriglobales bacterium]
MKFYVCVFCFGAGMLQNAMERAAGHVLHIKLWLFWLVNVTAIAATVAELVLAFKAFHWWGFVIGLGFFGLPDFIFFRRWRSDPAPFFYVGLLATISAGALLIWR